MGSISTKKRKSSGGVVAVKDDVEPSQSSEYKDLAKTLKAIVAKVSKLDVAEPFMYPVDGRTFPDYYEMIKHPMDLSTLKDKIPSYESKEAFLADAELIESNCRKYNLPESDIIGWAAAVVADIREQVVVIYT